MDYLTLNDIKEQIVMDKDFTDDDSYLEGLGDTAEQLVEKQIDMKLYEVAGKNDGELPAPLIHAMKLIVEFLYDNRGSGDTTIPDAFFYVCQLYRSYH